MNDPSVAIKGMKILIVDDVPANIDIIRKTLDEEGFSISMATNGETGISIAKRVHPDLILLDVMMPGIDGFETCKRLKADEKTREISVIFITARNAHEDIIQGFSAGGVDYISKPINMGEVLARVQNHLRLKKVLTEKDQLIQQLKDLNELLKSSNRMDSLTGLPNRTSILESLEYERNRLYGTNGTFSVSMAKLSNLNSINSSFGSYVADQVLRSIGRLLRQNLQETHLVGRLYGSEFLIVLTDTPQEKGELIIKELIKKIKMEKFMFDGSCINPCLKFAIGNITKDQDNLDVFMRKIMGCLEDNGEGWKIFTADF